MTKYEKIYLDENLPIKLFRLYYERPGPEVLKHWHTSIEILLPIMGKVEIWNNGKTDFLDDRMIYIINSQNIHSVTLLPCDTVYSGYCLQINYQYLKTLYPNLDMFKFKQPNDEIAIKIKKILFEMLKIKSLNQSYDYIALKGYTDVLIYLMVQYLLVPRDQNIKKYQMGHSKIVKIVNYIDKHFDEELTLCKIAEQFHISQSYLSRYFKDCLDISVKEYIFKIRLNKACFDLKNTDLSILDIALKNGFPNTKSMVHVFKKNLGCTPGSYRKDYK